MSSPHRTMRRGGLLAVAVVAAIALVGCLNPTQQRSYDLLNNTRVQNGRRKLNGHELAQRKAQAWAEKMAREQRMYHSNLTDGMGNCWRSLGENVGYATTIQGVHDLWWSSAPHKKNILDTKWNGVGVGVAKASNGYYYLAHVFVQTC